MDRAHPDIAHSNADEPGAVSGDHAVLDRPVVDEAYLVELFEASQRAIRRLDAMERVEEVAIGQPSEPESPLPIAAEVLALLAGASNDRAGDSGYQMLDTAPDLLGDGGQAFVPTEMAFDIQQDVDEMSLSAFGRLTAEPLPLEVPRASPRRNSEATPALLAAPSRTAVGRGHKPFREIVPCPQTFNGETLKTFLLACAAIPGIADVLMQSGDYVWGKIHNVQRRLTARRLESEEVEFVASHTYGNSAIGVINSGIALDYRAEQHRTIDDTVSFRANATRCRVGDISDGLSITLRYVTDVPRPFASLGLERDIEDNMFVQYGLVLIVGTTGSGKSTILASSVLERLENRTHDPVKVIFFESPTETTFQLKGLGNMPLVSQVEIGLGRHLNEFSQVGPNAMRRGGDVLIVGEMRDRESVDAAFELAMTGHAVYATLHVERPEQVIDRIVSFFPEDAQPAAASKLRSVLKLVVAQKQFANTEKLSERVRSWCVFDREVLARLSEVNWHQWERLIGKVCAERGTDFDSRVLEILLAGRLTFERFRNITGLTKAEAIAYCEEKGINVRDLG